MTTIRRAKGLPLPVVFIDRQAYQDMRYISLATKDEVGWFALVEEIEGGDFFVSDVYVPRQESHGTTVEFQPDMLAEFAEEYMDMFPSTPEGLAEATASYNKLRLWGHSHHTMGVSPSGQDQDTVDALAQAVDDTFLALRMNHRGEVQVDIARPDGFTLQDVTVGIDRPKPERRKQWEAIVKDRLKRKTYSTPKGGGKKLPGVLYPDRRSTWEGQGSWSGSNTSGKSKAKQPQSHHQLEDGDPDCTHEWVDTSSDVYPEVTCITCGREEVDMDALEIITEMAKQEGKKSATEEAVNRALDS